MNAQVAEHQVNDSEVHNRVGHLRAARRTQTRACATSCTSEGEPLSFPEGGGFSKTVFLSLLIRMALAQLLGVRHRRYTAPFVEAAKRPSSTDTHQSRHPSADISSRPYHTTGGWPMPCAKQIRARRRFVVFVQRASYLAEVVGHDAAPPQRAPRAPLLLLLEFTVGRHELDGCDPQLNPTPGSVHSAQSLTGACAVSGRGGLSSGNARCARTSIIAIVHAGRHVPHCDQSHQMQVSPSRSSDAERPRSTTLLSDDELAGRRQGHAPSSRLVRSA